MFSSFFGKKPTVKGKKLNFRFPVFFTFTSLRCVVRMMHAYESSLKILRSCLWCLFRNEMVYQSIDQFANVHFRATTRKWQSSTQSRPWHWTGTPKTPGWRKENCKFPRKIHSSIPWLNLFILSFSNRKPKSRRALRKATPKPANC